MATATLGCGEYRVFVFPRGGYEAVADITGYKKDTPFRELTFSSCRFSRILRQTSSATITLVDECWEQIADIVPMEHEIAIYRDNVRVWSGPLVSIKGKSANDPVTLEARDMSWWLSRRVPHRSHNYTNRDLAEIFSFLFADAMISNTYNPGILLSWSTVGVLKDRRYPQNTKTSILGLMDNLAQAGVPWYCIDRTVTAGGLVTGGTPVAYLSDRDFIEDIDWEINGFELINRMYAATNGDGEKGPIEVAAAQWPTSITTYGLLEDFVENDSSIDSYSEALVRSAKELVDVREPILTYTTSKLSYDADIEFSDLVPGNLIELSFTIVTFLQTQTLKLGTVEVDFGPEHESITLGLLPMSEDTGATLLKDEQATNVETKTQVYYPPAETSA